MTNEQSEHKNTRITIDNVINAVEKNIYKKINYQNNYNLTILKKINLAYCIKKIIK